MQLRQNYDKNRTFKTMITFIPFAIVLATCAYVLYPLFSGHKATTSEIDFRNLQLMELLHQKDLIADTLSDLEFDLQTGKLSEQDYAVLTEEQRLLQMDIEKQIHATSGGSRQEIKHMLEAEVAAEVQRLRGKSPANCPKCGHRIGANDKFCASCGEKLFN